MLIKYLALILLMGIQLHATPGHAVNHQQPKGFTLIITDTIIKSRGTQVHSIAVNGQRPPRIMMITGKDPANLRIYNRTRETIYLELPGKLLGKKTRTIRQTIQKDLELSVVVSAKNAGVYTYRIYQLEQVDNGALGSLVIQ